MYKISITGRAEKDLKKLERSLKNRIITAISSLSEDPHPHGSRKVQSEEGVWRVRISDWSFAYMIDSASLEITIFRIAHLREFYG